VPKHKQKAKKHHFTVAYRKPLLAALAFIVVAMPTSWMLVSAHPADDTANAAITGKRSDQTGRSGSSSSSTSGAKNTDSKTASSSDKSKSSDKKTSDADAKKQAQASGSAAAGGSASSASGAKAGATPSTSAATPAVTPTPAAVASYGVHANIISTIFWVGEPADASNANISNAESAWDGNWQTHYGGFDDPDHRNGYYPATFTPNENPFYFALPYNDLDANGHRKATASNCPNTSAGVSWCKNAWIKITKGAKVSYAQWQDVGPLQEDDTAYVFGTAAPKNTWGAKAGVDVSPAVRDYLGLADVDRVSWNFVSAASVPAGPWKNIVTSSPGGW
jgi:hypothetical protein